MPNVIQLFPTRPDVFHALEEKKAADSLPAAVTLRERLARAEPATGYRRF